MATVFRLKNLILSAVAAVLVAVLSVLVYTSGAYAVYFGGTPRKIPIYSVGREDKYISITFDCAWGTDHTDGILEALAGQNVRATFFMVQFWTEKYPDYVKKISDAGNEIGTHSKTHSYMSKLSASQISAELESSSAAIEAVTGKKVDLFRAPYGDYDDELVKTAEKDGYYTIQWDVDSLDWKGLSAAAIHQRVVGKVKDGSIVLFHNNSDNILEALPLVIETLRLKKFTFAPVGDVVYKTDYYVDNNGTQHKKDIQ